MRKSARFGILVLGVAGQLWGCGSSSESGVSNFNAINSPPVISSTTTTASSTATTLSPTPGDPVTPPVSSQTASVTLHFSLQGRQIPNTVQSFRFTGLGAQGDVLYGPLTTPSQATVMLSDVPTSVQQIQVELLTADVVRGLARLRVELVAGKEFAIADPAFDEVEAVLRSITLESSMQSVFAGSQVTMSARGEFNDATQSDLTDSVTWSSDNEQVARVDSHGVVTTLQAGEVAITARLGEVSASKTLQVTAVTLSSLSFPAQTTTFPRGVTAALLLQATYSDQSTQPVTDGVTWTSDNEAVAQFINGQLKARTVGSTTIHARIGSVSADLDVQISEAAQASVSIIGGGNTVVRDQIIQLGLNANYTDGSSRALSQVAWTSSNELAATVTNDGRVTGGQSGSTTLTATDLNSGQQATLVVRVSDANLTRILLTPAKSYLFRNETAQLQVVGLYDDNVERVLTKSAVYSSSSGSVQVSNTYESRGRITAQNPGTSVITATYPHTSLSAQVDVRSLGYVQTGSITPPHIVNQMVRDHAGSRLWVLTDDELCLVDPSTRTTLYTSQADGGTWMELSPDGSRLLVCHGTGSLHVFDAVHLQHLGEFETGTAPVRAVTFASASVAYALIPSGLLTLDLTNQTVVRNDSFPQLSTTSMLRADAQTQTLIVTNRSNSPSSLYRFSLVDGVPTYREMIYTNGGNGQSLKVNPGRGFVFPGSGGVSGRAYAFPYYGFNSLVNNLIGIFDIGVYPSDATFNAAGDLLFGVNGDTSDRNIYISRTDTCALLRKLYLQVPSDLNLSLVETTTDDGYVCAFFYNRYVSTTRPTADASPRIFVYESR